MAREPDEIYRELVETAEGRRELTRLSGGVGMAWYAQYYLRLATPQCHERWYAAFDSAKRLLFEAPRSHGKSISAGRVFVGRSVLINRNIRILLIGQTKGAASKTARLVRQDFEKNERILSDWTSPSAGGPFREKGLTWTDSLYYVCRTKNLRDPTVEAVGVGGSITGGRFDIIILDDPIDDKNTVTRAQRRKIEIWFFRTIVPLLDVGGRIVVIGTRKHADDLYNTLEQNPRFDVVRDGAFVDGLDSVDMSRVRWISEVSPVTGVEKVVDAVYEPAPGQPMPRVLWPEKWSVGQILAIYKEMGSVGFLQEYQNVITDDGTSPFKTAWLEKCKQAGKTRGFLPWGQDPETGKVHPRCEGMVVWQSWDLTLVSDETTAEESDSDYTVGQTWGLGEGGRRYLLRAVRVRGLTPTQVIALIRREADLFPQRIAVVVENNSFGRLYELGLRRVPGMPVFGHLTDARKHSVYEGVPAMSALYENDHVVLPYSGALAENEEDPRAYVDEHVREHHGLGKENHDDTVLCGWIAMTWIRRWLEVEERRKAARSGAGSGRARVIRAA